MFQLESQLNFMDKVLYVLRLFCVKNNHFNGFVTGLLPRLDRERLDCVPACVEASFLPQAGAAGNVVPGASRARGLRPSVLASLLQRHHASVSILYNCEFNIIETSENIL